jgi:hypothetical protein
MNANVDRGFDLLRQFIASCAFVHDDVWNEMRDKNGNLDWDQFSSNAILLGAHTVVLDTLNGFGDKYLSYLETLVGLPQSLIIPKVFQESLIANLLCDKQSLQELRTQVLKKKLDISSFYSDKDKDFETLVDSLANHEHVPRVHPAVQIFESYNDKVTSREFLESHELPVAEGMICKSIDDVEYFYHAKREFQPILLKRVHWGSKLVSSGPQLQNVLDDLIFPLVAETCYENVISTPVSHIIKWQGRSAHLFTLNQIIINWKHYGNRSFDSLDKTISEGIIALGEEFLSFIDEYTGLLGIDFIITSDGRIFIVDINPRFNASTYPAFFLHRLGFNIDSIKYEIVAVEECIPDLATLFMDPRYRKLTKSGGMFLFQPVWDFKNKNVYKFTYMCVAPDCSTLQDYHKILKAIIRDKRIV